MSGADLRATRMSGRRQTLRTYPDAMYGGGPQKEQKGGGNEYPPLAMPFETSELTRHGSHRFERVAQYCLCCGDRGNRGTIRRGTGRECDSVHAAFCGPAGASSNAE